MATRWGICSAGKISNDVVTALQTLPQSEHQVCAVAARNIESAKTFAEKFSIPRVYGSYEDLTKDDDLDIVYIGTIHPHHHKLCLMFLNAGKNILVEKPITMCLKHAQEIFDLAKEKKLFVMENLWSRFFPVYHRVRQELASGILGEVKLVTSDHSIVCDEVERMYDTALGGGAILDLGLYPVQFACMVFNHEKPEKIIATGFKHPHSGADETVSITLLYKGNRMAQLTCSMKACGTNLSTISGTDGLLTVDNPSHCALKCTVKGEEHHFPLADQTGSYIFRNSAGMVYQANAVRECLLKGEIENPLASHAHSLMIMYIMEESLRQIGVTYDLD